MLFLFNGGEGRSSQQREAFLDALKLTEIITADQSTKLRYLVQHSALFTDAIGGPIPTEQEIQAYIDQDA